ncbi:MAG: type II toxin-antitoxin system VapB family antitoxin [Moorellales bacterium]
MRFSVTVEAELLSEAMRLSGMRRKREVIELALKEFVRSRQVEELRRLAGSGVVDWAPEELEAWRTAEPEARS